MHLASSQRSKLKVKKNLPEQPDCRRIGLESGQVGNSLSTSNFGLWYFFSLLTYKNVQYLIWKIWFISVWKMKAKAMAWILIWFMITQSTLISYHTEPFVKTEVACTVCTLFLINNRICISFIRIFISIFHSLYSCNLQQKDANEDGNNPVIFS